TGFVQTLGQGEDLQPDPVHGELNALLYLALRVPARLPGRTLRTGLPLPARLVVQVPRGGKANGAGSGHRASGRPAGNPGRTVPAHRVLAGTAGEPRDPRQLTDGSGIGP